MRWDKNWRKETWETLDQPWDIIVIGGGVTGAGILRMAVNAGLKVLLLDANDFAFGTSSRSSKLIHGGFRYLSNKQFDVTYESVTEREWLLREAKHLVTPLPFMIPIFEGGKLTESKVRLGTLIYDLMAKKWQHKMLSHKKSVEMCPLIRTEDLQKAVVYYDAQMDDSRFVLRVIREAVMKGASALNYAKVSTLLRNEQGRVNGVRVQDQSETGFKSIDVRAQVVINAAGPWSDEVRLPISDQVKIRKLRGSHLVIPLEKLPLSHAVTLYHPDNGRTLFAIPWEGTLLFGTTDLDNPQSAGVPGEEPYCTEAEVDYLLRAIGYVFPGADVRKTDIISSMAGLRPIISTGAKNPSDESRAHQVWEEEGLISVGGGKITIFRVMAKDVLNRARKYLPGVPEFTLDSCIFEPLPEALVMEDMDDCFTIETMNYLAGRYGLEMGEMLAAGKPGEFCPIEPLPNIWAEVRWAVHSEGVVHLDDLLLRRVRLGMLLPNGGENCMPQIKQILQEELDWSEAYWEKEYSRYRTIWEQSYAPVPKQNFSETEGE